MHNYKKLIFICSTNSFLSPLAETVFRRLSNLNIECFSRGIVVMFPEPISPRVNDILQSTLGFECTHESTIKLERNDITEDTLLITMNTSEKIKIVEEYEVNEVYTLGEFIGLDVDVKDPYGQEDERYAECTELLIGAVKEVIKKLSEG
ncbi:MAG: hypothetical protein K6D02_07620 [Lachnospiraceae bacterium]|nr:hypothetical protein [Lachnospiraceae bacterium]